MGHALEAPEGSDDEPEWDELYLYRGDEIVAHRPVFTGDVFEGITVPGDAEPKMVSILQHPCAIRAGVDLASRLLVGEVVPADALKPSLWPKQSFKVMPLVRLRPDTEVSDYAVMFVEHHVVSKDEFTSERRVACLDQKGVNLQMQRWVFHNTRFAIPCFQLQEVTEPQFEEADIVEDWCTDRGDDGISPEAALLEIDEWLSEKVGKHKRRDLLKIPEKRAEVRRGVAALLRALRTPASL